MGTVGSRGGQRLLQRTGGRCSNTSEPWEVSGGLFLGEQREGSGEAGTQEGTTVFKPGTGTEKHSERETWRRKESQVLIHSTSVVELCPKQRRCSVVSEGAVVVVWVLLKLPIC